ncbi:PREDICTED: coiled-coil domain-containing protein 94 homolog [Camelina sativa]|uniref:Coiled-coil domain-containing protein 94 homolog n=1 Tax=Camelina sativa TaxID=90675 RepID=A0ABM0TTF1_CAMSA|nr:PREDICTED: coiled-coil domain-containing protein 94 homolog [Camelina sativa]
MYIGIQIHRFYIKCTKCLAEVIIKTDPKNSSYTVESGATCLYNGVEEKEKRREETENALESLERRTVVSKREIEVMAALDEVKSMKSRRASVSVDSMLEALSRRKKQEEENVEEELLIKSIKFASDHKPLVVSIGAKRPRGKRSFMFDRRWIGKAGLMDAIASGWDGDLVQWRKSQVPYGRETIEDLKRQLEVALADDSIPPSTISDLQNRLRQAYGDEEIY